MRHGRVSIIFFKGRQTIFRNLYQKPGTFRIERWGSVLCIFVDFLMVH